MSKKSEFEFQFVGDLSNDSFSYGIGHHQGSSAFEILVENA